MRQARVASVGSKSICKVLLQLATQTTSDLKGKALAVGAHANNNDLVRFFIEQGAEVNRTIDNTRFGTALIAVAWMGDLETVRLLIEKGADVNTKPIKETYVSALAAVAAGKRPERVDIVKLLIEHGTEVNLQLRMGYGNALIEAVIRSHFEIAELLIEKEADVNMVVESGSLGSALHAAVKKWQCQHG